MPKNVEQISDELSPEERLKKNRKSYEDKYEKLYIRCTSEYKNLVYSIAQSKDISSSDFIRIALKHEIMNHYEDSGEEIPTDVLNLLDGAIGGPSVLNAIDPEAVLKSMSFSENSYVQEALQNAAEKKRKSKDATRKEKATSNKISNKTKNVEMVEEVLTASKSDNVPTETEQRTDFTPVVDEKINNDSIDSVLKNNVEDLIVSYDVDSKLNSSDNLNSNEQEDSSENERLDKETHSSVLGSFSLESALERPLFSLSERSNDDEDDSDDDYVGSISISFDLDNSSSDLNVKEKNVDKGLEESNEDDDDDFDWSGLI